MKISSDWQPDDYDFIVNPFPFYDRLRGHSSVFQSPTGDYVLLKYTDVKQALSDKTCSAGVRKDWMTRAVKYAEKKGENYDVINRIMDAMLFQLNPDAHTAIRHFFMKYWPDKNWIEKTSIDCALQVIKELPDEGNLVTSVSRKLPLMVINKMLGSDFSSDKLMEDGIELLRTLDPYLTANDLNSIHEASVRFYEAFEKFYKNMDPSNHGFSSLIKKNEAFFLEQNVHPVSVLIFLYLAGQDTTANMISSCLETLLKDKKLIPQLESEEKIDAFINEVLRLHSPVQLTERINSVPMKIGDTDIPANSILSLCIGAANRDPNAFESPNDMKLDRDGNRHISFGFGIHHCIGNQIALIEARVIIQKMLPYLQNAVVLENTIWDKRLSIRNIRSLKVKFND